MFNTSHARHHRYTLHQPDDLEVTLPVKIIIRHLLVYGIINPKGSYWVIKDTIRVARAKFRGEWELKLFPVGSPERAATVNWARTLLVGHGLILVFSIYFHLWLLPVLTTLNGYYGSWLQGLCNNTQHIGLQDDVSDFRLCCRTFTLNPFVQFLYWHMNFHIEHHMFAAVPCYRLGRLHRLIKHDLPPCPHGIIATWKEIAAIQKIQETNPDYQHVAPLPNAQRSEPAPPQTTPACNSALA
jgi:fatty acid desaturase